MSKSRISLRNIYLYLVCLITLIIFIVSAIQTVDNTMDVILGNDYYYETFEMYKQRYVIRDDEGKVTGLREGKTEESIRIEFKEFKENQKTRQRNQDIKSLVTSIAALIISSVFWMYHWKQIQIEKD